jgi:hypothetical protein
MSYTSSSLFGIQAPTNEVQATLSASTSTAAVDALAAITDGQRRQVVFQSLGAATRIRFGAAGVGAASATTGIVLADGATFSLWMDKGINSYYRAFSTGTPQLTVFVVV